MPEPVTDNYGRQMTYLRLAVTERCNLRCRYCMPETGINLVPRRELLTWEELSRLSRIFVGLGVSKIRITRGEPFVRKDLLGFLGELSQLRSAPEVAITTNGTLLEEHLPALADLGIRRLNISLDSLEEETFRRITRRDGFHETLSAIRAACEMGFNVKINVVVLPGVNDHALESFIELIRDRDLTVRFIEPMPFDGGEAASRPTTTGQEILARIRERYDPAPVEGWAGAVSRLYAIPGYRGRFGIIEGYTRNFCHACSRIRVSARGALRTCLYGTGVLDLKHLLRAGRSDDDIRQEIIRVLQHRYRDGFEAERARTWSRFESMATVGG